MSISSEPRHKSRENILCTLTLVFFPLLLYANTLGNSFQYDDTPFILNNRYVHDLSGLAHFFVSPRLMTNPPLSGYRPLTMGSFALNYAIGGASPMGYHLVNVILHVLNTLLVYGVSLSLMRAFAVPRLRYAALATALLFAVHPINTQSVDYVFGRSSLLVGFFSLTSLLFYMRGRESAGTARALIMMAASLAACLCALLSKEEAVALPCLLAVYELCRVRMRIDKRKIAGICLSLAPFVALTLGFMIFVIHFMGIVNDTPQARGVWENLLTQARAVFLYLKLIVIPTNLSIDHVVATSSSILEPLALVSVITGIGLLAVPALVVRNAPMVPFGVWWFAFALAPSSTLVALRLVLNEQRMYLAAIGMMLIAGAGFAAAINQSIVSGRVRLRRALVCGFVLILAAFAALTVRRNVQWRTPFSLWMSALEKYPTSVRANTQAAALYLESGELDDALEAATRAVRGGPDVVETRTVLASVYSRMGRLEEALVEARIAVDLNPASSDAQAVLGTIYARLGRYDEAEASWTRSLEIDPENISVRENLELLKERKTETANWR